MTNAKSGDAMDSRILLVTGGSRGIGAAVAQRASRDGWQIALGYRDDEGAAQRVVDGIRQLGGTAQAFRADVGDPEAVDRLFGEVERELGLPTALVNNAGITGGIGAFVDVSLHALRRVLDVNVLGTMLCSQALIRSLQRAGQGGCIVNISSTAATLGASGEYVHYAASKAAVDAFTAGLAREVAGSGIRVNAVAPGTTDTDIHAAGGDAGRAARVAGRIPLGRAAQPAEIAEAVVWLLSPPASYVTGSVLRAGGGL
jgi:NAD(P)-dependent dehydrogenase (short-subunit alcohol dehydrogenase family)